MASSYDLDSACHHHRRCVVADRLLSTQPASKLALLRGDHCAGVARLRRHRGDRRRYRPAGGRIYRLVGFDTPETGRNARCERERTLGATATRRLTQLIGGGGHVLTRVPCACPSGTEGTSACNYGRLRARLTLQGRDVGAILIREGLARPFDAVAAEMRNGVGDRALPFEAEVAVAGRNRQTRDLGRRYPRPMHVELDVTKPICPADRPPHQLGSPPRSTPWAVPEPRPGVKQKRSVRPAGGQPRTDASAVATDRIATRHRRQSSQAISVSVPERPSILPTFVALPVLRSTA
jgi:endonuclease YncB( thermonuclease family)